MVAATGGEVAAIVVALFARNVAGLRDRMLTPVGARHGVPLQAWKRREVGA